MVVTHRQNGGIGEDRLLEDDTDVNGRLCDAPMRDLYFLACRIFSCGMQDLAP